MALHRGTLSFRERLVISIISFCITVFCALCIKGGTLFARPVSQQVKKETLAVPSIGQEVGNWCWAASAQMVMCYLINEAHPYMTFRQCRLASDKFKHECCNGGDAPDHPCNRGAFPDFEKYGFTAKRTNGNSLSDRAVIGQIQNKRPVLFSWRKKDGQGHMAVIIGYLYLGDNLMLKINDPSPIGKGDTTYIPFRVYVNGPDPSDRHWRDFYDITHP